jgi:hypothetical protein
LRPPIPARSVQNHTAATCHRPPSPGAPPPFDCALLANARHGDSAAQHSIFPGATQPTARYGACPGSAHTIPTTHPQGQPPVRYLTSQRPASLRPRSAYPATTQPRWTQPLSERQLSAPLALAALRFSPGAPDRNSPSIDYPSDRRATSPAAAHLHADATLPTMPIKAARLVRLPVARHLLRTPARHTYPPLERRLSIDAAPRAAASLRTSRRQRTSIPTSAPNIPTSLAWPAHFVRRRYRLLRLAAAPWSGSTPTDSATQRARIAPLPPSDFARRGSPRQNTRLPVRPPLLIRLRACYRRRYASLGAAPRTYGAQRGAFDRPTLRVASLPTTLPCATRRLSVPC